MQFIEKAILSVIDQDYPNIEHIIVDGGSRDGTLEIIAKYDHLSLIEEKDRKGVYNANNLGFKQARGELIGILNSDDFYSDNIFQNIVNIFMSKTIEVVSGGAEFFYQNGENPPYFWMPDTQGDALTQALSVPLVNACFFRKSLLDRVNGFDPQYRLAGDREMLIRLACQGVRLCPLEEILYHYRLHINALTSNPYDQWHVNSRLERLDIMEKYLNESSFGNDELKKLRGWHGLNAAWLVRAAMAQWKFIDAFRHAYRSWHHHSDWLGNYLRIFAPSPSKVLITMKDKISGVLHKFRSQKE